MQKVKVNFTDFWPGLKDDNYLLRFLQRYYQVELCDKPDYLFYSVYGDEHLHYEDCIKICFTGENLVPDFNLCDYALGFHYLDFEDRYLRYPLYLIYPKYDSLLEKKAVVPSEVLKRKFCNFVYSNASNADPVRDAFFHELSKYKPVDSGGRHMNNIGGPVVDKMEFIREYKFTLAFENSRVNGYTTEKIMEPMVVNSIPIYYGNPLVDRDFNPSSFIQVKGPDHFDEAIQTIIALDQNDVAYLEMIGQPWIREEAVLSVWEEKLEAFLRNIFDREMTQARRRARHGFNKYSMEQHLEKSMLFERKKRIGGVKYRVKSMLGIKN